MATILRNLLKVKQRVVLQARFNQRPILQSNGGFAGLNQRPILQSNGGFAGFNQRPILLSNGGFAGMNQSPLLQSIRGFASVSVTPEYKYVIDSFGVPRLHVRWSGPRLNGIKGNCDYSGKAEGAGVSFFFRDSDCEYIGGGYQEVPKEANSTTGEGYALLKSLEKADMLCKGIYHVWIETDSKAVIDDLDDVKKLNAKYRALMNRIRIMIDKLSIKCGGSEATFIHREANDPANIMSRLSEKGSLEFSSIDEFPESIKSDMITALNLNKSGEWFEVLER